MALTDKENFRLGFLSCCARMGLTPVEVRQLTKQASAMIKRGYGVADLLKLYWQAPLAASMYGLAGAAGVGALGGHTLAKMTEEEVDPAEAKRQELLAVYKQQAERARRNAARIRYRQNQTAPKPAKLF